MLWAINDLLVIFILIKFASLAYFKGTNQPVFLLPVCAK